MIKLTITKESKPNIEELMVLERKCFIPALQWTADDYESFLSDPNASIWVARQNGKIVGFLMGDCVSRILHAEINTINVEPTMQGKGIASQLIERAEKFWKAQMVRLQVHVNNPAQTLYFKHGFRVVDIEKGYYQDGGDALVMEKRHG